ncbi:MAG: DUF6399 domain-containing protein [Thermosynechococcaceae cyanobacterium]
MTLSKQLKKVHGQLQNSQHKGDVAEVLEAQLAQLRQKHAQIENAQQSYAKAMQQITTQVHPFRLDGREYQTALSLQAGLQQPLKTRQALAESLHLAKATTALDAFKKQIPAMAMGLNAWWSWVNQALEHQAAPPEESNWLISAMLPWVYWKQQADKTMRPHLKSIYQQAAETAYATLNTHTLTATLTQQKQEKWWDWSLWMVAKFQRTSSAVEGRNGYLSRLHHTSRGLEPMTSRS